jgi:hypothetical protein
MTLLTFLIPVRHPANARDWSRLKANLAQTVKSIAAQTNDDWQGLIVANEGSDLPPLPERFSVEWVRFLPNDLHDKGRSSRDDYLDAFRLDKGRRVLKGMLRAQDSRYFMIVDDDDFVNFRITRFVAEHAGENGWYVDRGYVWNDGGRFLLKHDHFNGVCGTSLIIRSDNYGFPKKFEDASPDFIKLMLGGHLGVPRLMADYGKPLAPLPFRGAIYRVGQVGSHSQTPSILRKYFLNRESIRHPRELLRKLMGLRVMGDTVKQEFFGFERKR